MTPEGRPGWGSQVLYTVVPPPAPTPHFSLVYTQPLYQPQILHAVQALAVQQQPFQATTTTSLPIATQPAVNQYFKEAKKKNVKPIAPKPAGARTEAIQESYCKKRKKAEWKIKDKQRPSSTGVRKMREQFILKADVKQQDLLESKAEACVDSDEDLCMPRLEVERLPEKKRKLSSARKVENRDNLDNRDPPVKPDESVKLSGTKSAQPNRVVKKQKEGKFCEPDSDGDDIITSLKRQVEEDDSDVDLFVPAKDTDGDLEENGEAAFEKLLTSAMPKVKRSKNPAWEESPPKKRELVSPRKEKPSLAVATAAPWGRRAPSFDLSEDYVNDYLKDKAKTDSTKSPDPLKPPGLLMISPPTPKRASSRAVSMDVIPACLPDSVGSEIGDILRGGFLTISPPGPRTPRRRAGRGSRSGRNSPQKVDAVPTKEKQSKSSSRTKSTEDLPPNLLPEDFLDEVIGQYFNADSTSEEEQTVESAHAVEVKSKHFTDSEDDDEDSSTEDGEHTGSKKRARSRPPASFFSMDFLEEPAHADKSDNHPEKVKTDIEIEKEYRHILFGGKKRKPSKISVGKKKKTPSPHKELRKRPSPEKVDKVRIVSKQKTNTVLREANGKTKHQQTVQPLKITVKSSHSAKSPAKEKDVKEHIEKQRFVHQHTWRGKMANSRAYDRTKMSQNTQRSRQGVSAKIEDVTGRYSKEEELAACGICEMLDPPIDPDNLNPEETTEWVGCDCLRWFHKGCTKLAKFTEKFSCKSVKMKCMEVDQEVELPQEESTRIAILKFCRDRDTIFIDDVMS